MRADLNPCKLDKFYYIIPSSFVLILLFGFNSIKMDELSGLLVSGGLLLAASLLTSNTSSRGGENEGGDVEETSDMELDEEPEAQASREAFDADFMDSVNSNNTKMIYLGNKFNTPFEHLRKALTQVKIETEIKKMRGIQNEKCSYLVLNLTALLQSNTFNEEKKLFQLLLSNGLTLIPGEAYGFKKPGFFIITNDVHNEFIINEIIDRFSMVTSIANTLKVVASNSTGSNFTSNAVETPKKSNDSGASANTPSAPATASEKAMTATADLTKPTKTTVSSKKRRTLQPPVDSSNQAASSAPALDVNDDVSVASAASNTRSALKKRKQQQS